VTLAGEHRHAVLVDARGDTDLVTALAQVGEHLAHSAGPQTHTVRKSLHARPALAGLVSSRLGEHHKQQPLLRRQLGRCAIEHLDDQTDTHHAAYRLDSRRNASLAISTSCRRIGESLTRAWCGQPRHAGWLLPVAQEVQASSARVLGGIHPDQRDGSLSRNGG
jgi:hypothetical protein